MADPAVKLTKAQRETLALETYYVGTRAGDVISPDGCGDFVRVRRPTFVGLRDAGYIAKTGSNGAASETYEVTPKGRALPDALKGRHSSRHG